MTGLLLPGVVVAALASGQAPAPPVSAQPEATPTAPFSKLFGAARPATRTHDLFAPDLRQAEAKKAPQTKVICGMVVVVPVPIDSRMVRPIPKDGVTYTMRYVPPPACARDK